MNASRQKILRWESGSPPARALDELAPEEPLEIRIDNEPVNVTMRSPGHDGELAAGFLLGEGLIRRREDVLKITRYPRNRDNNVLGVFLAPDISVDMRRLARRTYVSSSCGICGAASIAEVRKRFAPVKSKFSVAAQVLLQLPDKLRACQETFARTGGIHAAGLFDLEGNLVVVREDIGRHNAVDKVTGHALLNGLLPLDKKILVVSGRVSFEIVQKALAARLPVVVAVSAPSNLAVEFARANGQTLVGFVRDRRLNVYSHPKRVRFGAHSSF